MAGSTHLTADQADGDPAVGAAGGGQDERDVHGPAATAEASLDERGHRPATAAGVVQHGAGAPIGSASLDDYDGTPLHSSKRDILAETGPLIAVLVAILVVVGLAALAASKTSNALLGVAIAGLIVATYIVITGTMRMTREDADKREDEAKSS